MTHDSMRLDHVNLRTAHLDRLIDFYTRALGLDNGPRPNFDFPGAWLYCDDRAVIHLVAVDRPPAQAGEVQLEHFAFHGTDIDKFVKRLDQEKIQHRRARVPGTKLTQVHLHDPDGNHLHVDFESA